MCENAQASDLRTVTYCTRNKSKSCESQARSPSHRFTRKSHQKFSLESTRKRTTAPRVRHPLVLYSGAMHSGTDWRSALWLNAMHSGKK